MKHGVRKEHRESAQLLIGRVALGMDLDHDTHVFLWITSRPIKESSTASDNRLRYRRFSPFISAMNLVLHSTKNPPLRGSSQPRESAYGSQIEIDGYFASPRLVCLDITQCFPEDSLLVMWASRLTT